MAALPPFYHSVWCPINNQILFYGLIITNMIVLSLLPMCNTSTCNCRTVGGLRSCLTIYSCYYVDPLRGCYDIWAQGQAF